METIVTTGAFTSLTHHHRAGRTAHRLRRIWRPPRPSSARPARDAGLATHVRAGARRIARPGIAPDRAGAAGIWTLRLPALREPGESAEDISAVANAYGLDRFAIIGVSGGGPFAIAAAAANLDRVVLLALACPVGPIADIRRHIRMSRMHYLLFQVLARSALGPRAFFRSLRYMVLRAPDTAYRWLTRRVRASDRELLARAEVRASLQAAVREGLRPGIEGAVQDLRLYCAPWRLPLAEIDVPAIVWQGSDDTIVPPAAAYALARTLPNCRLDVIPAAGHYWVFGQFGLILDAVAAALGPTQSDRGRIRSARRSFARSVYYGNIH